MTVTDLLEPPEKIIYQQFHIDNITVTHAPLLKVYYWEALGIDELNNKLATNDSRIEHQITIPTAQLNSRPLKLVIWVRNTSNKTLDIRLKRIKNCACVPLQTRIGFNQFRSLYQCPHRCLIHFQHELLHIPALDMTALSMMSFPYLFGKYVLSYELICSDKRVVHLDCTVDILGFDPQKCVLTTQLLPLDIREFERIVQPIWVRNITMQQLSFVFSSRNRGLKLINPKLTVPSQSVWPLMVEYRPSHTANPLQLSLQYDCVLYNQSIDAIGYYEPPTAESLPPNEDNDCNDFPYVLYPNRLDFELDLDGRRSQMVAINNHSQKCMEFRWQNYIINQMFEITFEPSVFRLRPHHSKLCVATVKAHHKPLIFNRIPAILEVHRVLSKCKRIARELLTEVESIDDPKLMVGSYIDHVFLHINVTVKPQPKPEQSELERARAVIPQITVFEKLFWESLARTNFMRQNVHPTVPDEYSYEEVMQLHAGPPLQDEVPPLQRMETLDVLCKLVADSLRELSKNWRFLPEEECE